MAVGRDRRRILNESGAHETSLDVSGESGEIEAEPPAPAPPAEDPGTTSSRRRLTNKAGDAATVGIESPGRFSRTAAASSPCFSLRFASPSALFASYQRRSPRSASEPDHELGGTP